MTDTPTTGEVLAEVARILGEVIGEEEMEMLGEITLDTSFNTDLELESIEFVALAELLLERYGGKVDFIDWIADMELDEIISMKVGDMVSFIVDRMGASDGGG
jgi:acyl carrier protein